MISRIRRDLATQLEEFGSPAGVLRRDKRTSNSAMHKVDEALFCCRNDGTASWERPNVSRDGLIVSASRPTSCDKTGQG